MEPKPITLIIKMSETDLDYDNGADSRAYERAIAQEEAERNEILGNELSAEPSPEETLTSFLSAFQARGRYHLADLQLDEDYLQSFLTNFALRVDGVLQKYRAGQIEHGGDLRDRDLRRERSQEIDDLLVYDVVDNTCCGSKVTVNI